MKEPNIEEHVSRYEARMKESKRLLAAHERRIKIRSLAMDSLMAFEFRDTSLTKQDVLTKAIHRATIIYDDVMAFDIPDKV